MLEDIDEVLEMMEIEEEPPMDDEIHPMTKSATDFKGFETLHNIVLNIDDQLLCYDVQTEADKCTMNCDNRLRCFNEMLTI